MRLLVTGGGTGGHVYPALEVARFASERGASVRYAGSLRGQEGPASGRVGIPFTGFPSEPLWSLRQLRGWRALVRLLRAQGMAKADLRRDRPDVVFSTGGYSAGPVMAAARSLGIPYVIHEGNSVPGRANRMFAARSAAFTCLFERTRRWVPSADRTGQPLRPPLLAAAADASRAGEGLLVIGGSQGSQFLNAVVPQAVRGMKAPPPVLHATGRGNEGAISSQELPPEYEVRPYLEADEVARALASCAVVVARSGSTVAELARFGRPSILVPFPTAADDHQLENAREVAELGGAVVLTQPEAPRAGVAVATPESVRAALEAWLADAERRSRAFEALRAWSPPDATERIHAHLLRAAGAKATETGYS